MISFIKQLLIASFLGFFLMVIMVQHDQTIKALIAQEFKRTFEECFDSSIECELTSINIFNGTLSLKDVHVTPKSHKNWSWSAKKFSLRCSLWSLLRHHRIDADIIVHNYYALSEIKDNKLAILEHINDLINGPPLIFPLNIHSVSMKNSRFQVLDATHDLTAVLEGDVESKKIGSAFKSTVYCVGGTVSKGNKKLFDSIKTSLHAEFDDQLQGSIKTISSCVLSEVPKYPRVTIVGTWHNNSGEISIKNEDASLVIDPIKITKNENEFVANFKGEMRHRFLKNFIPLASNLDDALVSFSSTASYGSKGFSLTGSADANIKFADIPIAIHADFDAHNAIVQGTYTNKIPDLLDSAGDWHFDAEAQHLMISGKVSSQHEKTAWQLLPESHFTFDASLLGNAKAECACTFYNASLNKSIALESSCVVNDQSFSCSGNLNKIPYFCSATIKPTLEISSLKYGNHDEISLNTIRSPGILKGHLNLSCIKDAVKFFLNYDLQAKGDLEIACSRDQNVQITTTLNDGSIRIPYTYNIVRAMQATITLDQSNSHIVFNDVVCSLHRGKIWTDRATISLDEHYKVADAHIPLFFDSCVLNYNKDLFAIISGNILLSQTNAKPLLSATVFFEHAHIKENIFADSFLKQIIKNAQQSLHFESDGYDVACNCSLQTINPLQIRTAFLQADAKLNLKVTQSLQSPKIDGTIAFVSGELKFPYRPLFINKGTLQFDPDHPLDPMIECIARNRIKNYNVALQVTGTILDPHILIESSPPLLEEQVLSLLLVGSKEDSLNVMVPAFVMHSIHPLLFGLAPSSQGLSNYFAKILKPFRKIHLIPTFTDQTGRGGLRGAFEVDVNERLHALIQKNFSLTEDTLFELEYLLSDEIGVKLFRDERRDVGAEVEMRWKF